jgi:palmitoyl-protein thioesterase
MGFSQGGLFLRSYAQFCPSPTYPPIHNLITFGTPHYGIAALIPCPTPPTLSCLLAARAARAGIYTPWAQAHLVQAAYFRDPQRLDEFVESNGFLRDLNGEGRLVNGTNDGASALAQVAEHEHGREHNAQTRPIPNSQQTQTQKDRSHGGHSLANLANLVLIMFDADRTVSPAESAHFATYSSAPDNENKTLIVPMEDQRMYTHDWIGLRALDQKGGVHLLHCPGEHMDLGEGDCAVNVVRDWVGW